MYICSYILLTCLLPYALLLHVVYAGHNIDQDQGQLNYAWLINIA